MADVWSMGPDEWAEWRAYFSAVPFPHHAEEHRAASLLAAVLNVLRTKNFAKPAELIPDYWKDSAEEDEATPRPQEMSTDEMVAAAMFWAASSGGRIE